MVPILPTFDHNVEANNAYPRLSNISPIALLARWNRFLDLRR
jgi:hypothetical protein